MGRRRVDFVVAVLVASLALAVLFAGQVVLVTAATDTTGGIGASSRTDAGYATALPISL